MIDAVVIAALKEADGITPASTLARSIGCTVDELTRQLEDMQRRGLVERFSARLGTPRRRGDLVVLGWGFTLRGYELAHGGRQA